MAAVRACAELCGGRAEGVRVGADELTFRPGPALRAGSFAWDIGTAGSSTMLALGILPLACFAPGPVTASQLVGRLTGSGVMGVPPARPRPAPCPPGPPGPPNWASALPATRISAAAPTISPMVVLFAGPRMALPPGRLVNGQY